MPHVPKQSLADRIGARISAHIADVMAPTHLCLDCHSRVRPSTHRLGAAVLCTLATIILAGAIFSNQPVPGILVAIALGALGITLSLRRGRCHVCGGVACIPLTSPRAKALNNTPPAT